MKRWLACFLAAALAVGAFAVLFYVVPDGKAAPHSPDAADTSPAPTDPAPVTTLPVPEDVPETYEPIPSVTAAASWQAYLTQWASCGVPMHSKHVLNVLLVGLDARDDSDSRRADTLLLVSVNKKAKTIHMTSVFRDTWTAMTAGGETRFGKINAAYALGGAQTLVDTVERDFKIDVDHYAAVDFSAFTGIINALGGLTVDVEPYEAEYIRSTSKSHRDFPSGAQVTLTGEEALIYARIRKSDADNDVSRTRRQRKVIRALLDRAKTADLSVLYGEMETLLPLVETDLTKQQLLAYAGEALSDGWPDFPVRELSLSDADVFRAAYVDGTSLVVVDFELAAYRLQTAVFGESCITLSKQRVLPFDLIE